LIAGHGQDVVRIVDRESGDVVVYYARVSLVTLNRATDLVDDPS